MTPNGEGTDRSDPEGPETSAGRPDAERFAALMERIATARDRSAFIALFDHFAPRIKGYLMRLGAGAEEAEELTQEVMLTLWRKADLFDRSKSSVATWLFRVARNRRIDSLRRDRSALLDADDPTTRPEAPPDPNETLDATTREERVRRALDGLPDEQVRLIRLSFFKGLSHAEIAAETGLPLGTVKSRIRLAFGRLRRTLEGDIRIDTP